VLSPVSRTGVSSHAETDPEVTAEMGHKVRNHWSAADPARAALLLVLRITLACSARNGTNVCVGDVQVGRPAPQR
jgi:hypothetical protein